jgi:chloramphenicol-sensitive protein RarD
MNIQKDPGIGRGLFLGVSAYLIWGSFPLIIIMLSFASPLEVVTWRIVFGFLVAAILTTVTKSWSAIASVFSNKNQMKWMILATAVIGLNWTVYVIGIQNQQTIETALGYFINPLVTILLAVIFLGEKLSRLQWVATGFGALAVVVLSFDYGRLPWIALVLAVSFGIYGLAKNKLGGRVSAINSFAIESGLLMPLAILQITLLQISGGLQFAQNGPWGSAGLIFFGVMTAIPLILFGTAAKLLPLRYLGFIQYMTPIIQFGIAIFIFQEPMPAARWVGFALVWTGLVILIFDAIRPAKASPAVAGPTL